MSHIFAKFDVDLAWENFSQSDLFISLKKVSNDTYLKIFDGNIFKNKTTPTDFDVLNSEAKLMLNNNNLTLLQVFSHLRILIYLVLIDINLSYLIIISINNYLIISKTDRLILVSSGSNDLNNTNNLRTKIINDLNFQSLDVITKFGFKNEYNIYMKNLNTIGKMTVCINLVRKWSFEYF